MVATTSRRRTDTESTTAGSVLAAQHLAPTLGNQDLLDLTLPGQGPFDDEAQVGTGPWLEGPGLRTADFLAGLREPGPGDRSAEALVQTFGPTW